MGKIYFVRHGQTVWNVENKICGASDIALTKTGHEQAIEAGLEIKRLGIKADEILYSPLIRAADTARHIEEITGIKARPEERLREQNFGIYESSPRDGAKFKVAKTQFLNRYDGGESMLRLAQRIYNLLDELTSQDKTYILVAHNGIARMVQSYFAEMSNEDYAAFGVKNCQVLEYESEGSKEEMLAKEEKKREAYVKAAESYAFYGAANSYTKALIDDYKGIETPLDLYEALKKVWCKETCAPRMQEDWSQDNYSLGQCSITAFLAQDIFGGKVYGLLRPKGNYHCFNLVGDSIFDLTSEQFGEEKLDYDNACEQFKEVHMSSQEKKDRYDLLCESLKKICQ